MFLLLEFVQLGKCMRQIHFLFTFSQFHFILHEHILILHRRKIISFPLICPFFSSSFPLCLLSRSLPTQMKLLQLKFLKSSITKKKKKIPLLEIVTKEFYPITHPLLGTSLTSLLNQSPIGILYCAWIILHEWPVIIQKSFFISFKLYSYIGI